MAEVMVDIHLAEAASYVRYEVEDSSVHRKLDYYFFILEKHEVSKDDFVASWSYYTKHPIEMQEIYTMISAKMKARFSKSY